MKSITKLMPKPVARAYIKSLQAAPTPVTKPYQRPLFSVRCMHRMPTGPMGAVAITPMTIPLKMKSRISSWKGKSWFNSFNWFIQNAKISIFPLKKASQGHFLAYCLPGAIHPGGADCPTG